MSAIVDVMLTAQTVTTLTAAGLVVVLFAIIVVLLRSRATHRHLEHTLALIEEHRVHEARIYARSAGASAAPLVAALSSEPAPPRTMVSSLETVTFFAVPSMSIVTCSSLEQDLNAM